MSLALADIYRVILLVELLTVMGGYSWALHHTLRSRSRIDDEVLRDVRTGVAWRHVAILLLCALFAAAVALSFGQHDAGRFVFNLLLQAAIVALILAWGKVDRRRFHHVADQGRSQAAAGALERLERAERHRTDSAARWRRERGRG